MDPDSGRAEVSRGSSPPHRDTEAARRARLVLRVGAVLGLLLVLRVLLGEKPWDEEVQQWLAEGRPKGFVAAYGWWAALGSALLVAALVATRRLWLGASGEPVELTRYAPPEGSEAGRPWFRPVVLAAVAVHAILAAPLLTQSLWGDEEHTVRQAVVGQWRLVDGVLDHDGVKWRDTLFYYTKGNNPVPMSALALMSWKTWTALGGDPWRSEPAVRAFAYLFGALSVLTVGLLLRRLGLPVAGVIAAWLLALHPWHLRYATQIRAYPLVLLLASASLLVVVSVLHRGTWRRWSAHGALQLLMLWVYPAALWFVVTLNAALGLALLLHHRGSESLRDQIARFLVTGIASGGVWMLLMLPNLAQFLFVLRDSASPRPGLVTDMLSFLLAGMPWPDLSASSFHPELADLYAAHPLLLQVFILASVALLALGAVRLALRGHGVVVATVLLAAPLTLLFAELQGLYLYSWYTVFALPGAVALVATGLATVFVGLRERRDFLAATATLALAYGAAFVWITHEPRQALRAHSYEPFRETTLAVRPSLDPRHPGNERILTVSVDAETDYYDPLAIHVDTVEELEEAMRRSREERKPLFVTMGRLDLIRQREPDVLARLRGGDDFVRVAKFPAFLEQYDRYVYHYRAGPGGGVHSRGVLEEAGGEGPE